MFVSVDFTFCLGNDSMTRHVSIYILILRNNLILRIFLIIVIFLRNILKIRIFLFTKILILRITLILRILHNHEKVIFEMERGKSSIKTMGLEFIINQ